MPRNRLPAVWTVLSLVILFCDAAAQAPAPSRGAMGPLPRVHFLATGGTISNRAGGRLTAEDLVKLIPPLETYAQPEFEQFSNVASSALTLDQYLKLARRINELFEQDKTLAGVVITSGTDTMEELAYFLHLTVRDFRPVVVVGAMRNASTIGYEGPANLLEGFRVAASRAAAGNGVMVVLNDEINSAREVTKTDALRLHTFQSRIYGVLGVVDADRVSFYRAPVKRHTAKSEFDVKKIETLPRVDVIMVYQDASGDLITAAAANGARGIVVAGAGAGATTSSQREAINAVAQKGVVVVMGTRTGSGRIAPGTDQAPSGGERRRNTAAAEDLAPVKARILLMLALAKTHDLAEIQRMFSEY
ncbi:MAG: asparaginase [Acidobacteria bacterium]|nr:asparaginase [Acidobacteriota bacterium]